MRLRRPRQMRWQRTSYRFRWSIHRGGRRRRWLRTFAHWGALAGPTLLQIFQPQFQWLDLPLQFLRLPPELHPPQLAQQQLQMFDLGLARLQPRVRRDVFLVFRYQHRLQRFPIQRAQVGKCGNQHEPQYAMKGHFVKYGAHKNLCKSNNVSTPTSADPTSAPVDANQCLLTASRAGLASDEQLLPKLAAKQTFLSPDVCKINIARLHQTRLVSPDRLFGRGR